jgi:hypothetical protein
MIGYYSVTLRNVVVVPGYVSNLGTVSMIETPPERLEYLW